MAHCYLKYSKDKIKLALDEIVSLEQCEFPYSHSEMALKEIKRFLESLSCRLDDLDPQLNAKEIIQKECKLALKALASFIPILGFILRSTNVRNAFEIFIPLLDISRKLLEPGVEPSLSTIKLILSSEWRYSPHMFVFHQTQILDGYILIGLPSYESSNPLLIPSTGHELGHAIWKVKKIKKDFRAIISKAVEEYINIHWDDFPDEIKKIPNTLPKKVAGDSKTGNLFILPTKERAISYALKQTEETFCDFIGLSIYGKAYLQSFAYLCAPKLPGRRSLRYPNEVKRTSNLAKAASQYGFEVPEDYVANFEDRKAPELFKIDQLSITIADSVFDKVVQTVIDKVATILDEVDIQKPDNDAIQEIYERFKSAVPFQNCNSVSDILNAAWRVYEEPDFWSQEPLRKNKDKILKELTLKNIEILGINQILQGSVS